MDQKSYLNLVPDEILFHIIRYLDNRYSINKLIFSNDILKCKFGDDEIWKKMFHQNIRYPVINKTILWIDNYYDNIDLKIKYKINDFGSIYCIDLLIIKPVVFVSESVMDNMNSLNIESMDIAFVKQGNFSYINKNDTKQIDLNILKDLSIINIDNTIGLRLKKNSLSLEEILFKLNGWRSDVFLSDTKTCRRFTVDDLNIVYVCCYL